MSEDYASVYAPWRCPCGYDNPAQCWLNCKGWSCPCQDMTVNDYRRAEGLPEFDTFQPEPPIRADILDEAKQAVCQDRNAEYGEPIDNFGRWAGVCNSLGYRGPGGRELKPHDMAIISTAGKLSRAMQTPGKRDHSVDISGYGSLIYELVTLEG